MVRTYRPDNYHLVSPWEQAMKNADQEEGQPLTTGKRMYNDRNVSQLSTDDRHKNIKLPPLGNDPHQLQHFLAEEVGKTLARSKEKLRKIKNEVVLYDPTNTGLIIKSSILEILKRYGVPQEEGAQRKLVELFQDQHEKGKVNRVGLLEFLEASQKAGKEKLVVVKAQEQQKNEPENFADSQIGRYDSQPTMQQETRHTKAKRGELVRQAFTERRDAGLLIELEHALEAYGTTVNPHDLLDELEEYLQRTCRNDENLVDSMHMKSVMDRHRFPINNALIVKCIDRLDLNDTGRIEWPKYIEFLRRAVKNSPRPQQHHNHNNPQQGKSHQIQDKPAWESRKPLSNINTQGKIQRQEGTVLDPGFNHLNVHNDTDSALQKSRSKKSQDKFYDLYPQEKAFNDYEDYEDYNEGFQFNDNSLNGFFDSQNKNHPQENRNGFHQMNEDLGAAFAQSLQKLRADSMDNVTQESGDRRDFESFSTRGEEYKRVADALHDKAKFSKGVITVGEIEKIVNYYNLLFDTNIPMEQVNHVITKHQSNGYINVKHIIDSFGTEIM